jgi:hypothetical protein
MQLKPSVIDKLALMICGDSPFNYFPYRSSSNLTLFFREIDLDYRHDGSTRKYWVSSVLEELNKKPPMVTDLPSVEIKNVIENLLSPVQFMENPTADHQKAVDAVRVLLKSQQNLTVVKDSNTGNIELRQIIDGFVSTSVEIAEAKKVITFTPSVFSIPNKPLIDNLVAVMMPFIMEFDNVYQTIKQACTNVDMLCYRVNDIWNNSAIIQDIFELIYCSSIVIVDFSNKNPNVFYEAGIAHTLGKNVIPITQSIEDIPFDLRHHRAVKYLNNNEGLIELREILQSKIKKLTYKPT